VGPLLRAVRISKSFGGVQALDRIDLSVERGEVVGLIGTNGAAASRRMKRPPAASASIS
jgi:ABC-type sugar transport system ATPase subunit